MAPGTLHELKALIGSNHPLIVIDTVEEERADEMIRNLATELKMPLYEWTITRGLTDTRLTGGAAKEGEPLDILRELASGKYLGLFLFKDFSSHLEDPVLRRAFREVLQKFIKSRSSVIMVGSGIDLPKEVHHEAVHFEIKLPVREDIVKLIEEVVGPRFRAGNVKVDMQNDDWRRLVDALIGLTMNQARQTLVYCLVEDGGLTAGDVKKALERKARLIKDGGLLEYFPPEANTFQIGGFNGLKKWLERVKVGFSDKGKEFNLAPPKGVLITGIQGCGKSLAAKYIARELKVPFLKLEASALYDKFIGETEKNLRKAIQMAESVAPAVLWIDEMEKAFGASGGEGAESAVSSRLLGYFLTWLQEKKQNVFVVGTTNDIFKLPAELQRKGRFDEIFYVDLPKETERVEIFRIHLGIRNLKPEAFDLKTLAAAATGFNGAEIEQCIVGMIYGSISENVAISQERLLAEVGGCVPLSVSRAEEIESIREIARERFVNVE